VKKANPALAWIYDLFSDEDDLNEPHFDPVHLGGAVIITLAVIGCLYWLLWTLLVYEGGIFLKIYALSRLAFTSATLKDLGYEGYPYAMGDLEGILGNFGALIISVIVVVALRRLYQRAASKHRKQ
jgi:hypothetical protein